MKKVCNVGTIVHIQPTGKTTLAEALLKAEKNIRNIKVIEDEPCLNVGFEVIDASKNDTSCVSPISTHPTIRDMIKSQRSYPKPINNPVLHRKDAHYHKR